MIRSCGPVLQEVYTRGDADLSFVDLIPDSNWSPWRQVSPLTDQVVYMRVDLATKRVNETVVSLAGGLYKINESWETYDNCG